MVLGGVLLAAVSVFLANVHLALIPYRQFSYVPVVRYYGPLSYDIRSTVDILPIAFYKLRFARSILSCDSFDIGSKMQIK
jgi:hypothetical protein